MDMHHVRLLGELIVFSILIVDLDSRQITNLIVTILLLFLLIISSIRRDIMLWKRTGEITIVLVKEM